MPLSKEEIRNIQKTGVDYFGQPLVVDGSYGPKTAWWYGITTLDEKRQSVQRLILGYHASNVGIETTGRNDGPFVDSLFESVKLQKRGYPWCAALTSHVYRKCGVIWPVYHVSAWSLIDWAKKHGRLVDEPLPSDLEAFLYPAVKGEDRKGHVRIVMAYDPVTKRTAGIDGNVNNTIRVGYRDVRPERYFVRPEGFTDVHGALTMPKNLIDLDGMEDR